MLTQSSAKLVCESISRNIAVLSWPDQAAERERLERHGAPRLWLVDAGVDPPIGESCLEDWLRLPADDADVRARLISLARRAAHHPTRPTIDDHGQLVRNGACVILSPLEHHIAAPLIEHFGDPVADDELIASAWHEGGNEDTLRVHVSRLRRRLAPVGLKIVSVRAATSCATTTEPARRQISASCGSPSCHAIETVGKAIRVEVAPGRTSAQRAHCIIDSTVPPGRLLTGRLCVARQEVRRAQPDDVHRHRGSRRDLGS